MDLFKSFFGNIPTKRPVEKTHKHIWTDWNITETGTLVYYSCGRALRCGTYLIQHRHCSECGFSEIDNQTKKVEKDLPSFMVPDRRPSSPAPQKDTV